MIVDIGSATPGEMHVSPRDRATRRALHRASRPWGRTTRPLRGRHLQPHGARSHTGCRAQRRAKSMTPPLHRGSVRRRARASTRAARAASHGHGRPPARPRHQRQRDDASPTATPDKPVNSRRSRLRHTAWLGFELASFHAAPITPDACTSRLASSISASSRGM